jgi:hypothetical protein
MVLLSNKLDSIFKNSITTPILDVMIEKDSANPLVNDLTKKINTSLLSIKKDINSVKSSNNESNTVDLSEINTKLNKIESDMSQIDQKINYVSDQVDLCISLLQQMSNS